MSFLGSTSPNLRFGPFELDAAAGDLRKAGTLIKLQPQPFQVLQLLVERAGTVVTREEIQRSLWSESTFVDFEHGINFAINQIRGALADNAERPRYIQTLPRRGYRFIGEVVREDSAKKGAVVDGWGAVRDPDTAGGNGAKAFSGSAAGAAAPSEGVVTAARGRKRRFLPAAIAIGIFLLGFCGFAIYRAAHRRPGINIQNLQFSKLTDNGKASQLAISSDGRYVAYARWDEEESG